MTAIPLNSPRPFHERTDWFDDAALVRSASACIAAQREAAADARRRFQPNVNALADVSADRLQQILAQGDDIHGISSDHSISNVISFNAAHIGGAVQSERVAELRRDVDARVTEKLRQTFEDGDRLTITCSGHFWYPPGGYMGWHTNSGAPGWRIYLTHAAEPGKSFFRYRDPADGEIVTSTDHAWDVRLFRIAPHVPLWHAVYSQTDRFSLGYVVHSKRPMRALAGRIKRLLGAR